MTFSAFLSLRFVYAQVHNDPLFKFSPHLHEHAPVRVHMRMHQNHIDHVLGLQNGEQSESPFIHLIDFRYTHSIQKH